MTIARRLYLLISIAVASAAILSGINFFQIDRVFKAANYANENTVPSMKIIAEANAAYSTQRVLTWQAISQPDNEKAQQLMGQANLSTRALQNALDRYEKTAISDERDRELLLSDRNALTPYILLRDRVFSLLSNSNPDAARELLLQNQPTVTSLTRALDRHREYNESLGLQASTQAERDLVRAKIVSAAVATVTMVLVTVVGVVLVRRIIESIMTAVSTAQTIAAGDLSVEISTQSDDEMGKLFTALNNMNISLATIVGRVRAGSERIAEASTEIATGNMDLSSRTEEQASSLEETASTIEQLTSTVSQNAQSANHASTLSHTAANIAEAGGHVVERVVVTMDAINEASKKIVDIISVIDGLAFQTNILALNAAVEAARAGEQGRGFAVVASEVRNLAQRSAGAAKEIKALIQTSLERVQSGTRLVDEAKITMDEVVTSVRRVTDVITEIATASAEQRDAIEQINQAVSQIDDMTQQNAALVEQAAAASQSLQQETTALSETVSIFKLSQAIGPQTNFVTPDSRARLPLSVVYK